MLNLHFRISTCKFVNSECMFSTCILSFLMCSETLIYSTCTCNGMPRDKQNLSVIIIIMGSCNTGVLFHVQPFCSQDLKPILSTDGISLLTSPEKLVLYPNIVP